VEEWTNELTKALAVCEAILDFPGEDPKLETSLVYRDVLPAIRHVKGEIDAALKDAKARELVRTGVRVCIVGATNAGKSTLLNYFAKRDVAIVSKVPGTTRDVVEVSLELNGRKVVIFDTAGHRFLPIMQKSSSPSEKMENPYEVEIEDEPLFDDEYERRVGKLSDDAKELIDEIEREGIERGKNVAKNADIIIEMIDATNPKRIDFENMNIKRENGVKIISVVNKSDALYFLDEEKEEEEAYSRFDSSLLRLSLRTGLGLDALTKAVSDAVHECTITASSFSSRSNDGATAAIARTRHRAHARAISNSLGACLFELNQKSDSDDDEGSKRSLEHSPDHPRTELVAEDLREALRNCSRVVGRLDVTENVLDFLFSEFCIGK
jgi:tRNA modification GTPase